MTKRILATVLAISIIVLTLTSCSDNYPAVESTEREATTVMTLKLGEEEYEIKYELYRAFFLTLKSEVDGGNGDVWTSENKGEYISRINGMIYKRLADIYSVFSIASEIGINIYSDEYNDMVKESIAASVDGGIIGSVQYDGFNGDYEKYLESLKEMYLNYSVQDLLIRYALALDDIYYYYGGNVENDAVLGNLKYTREDVQEFYNSDECVRVYQLYLSTLTTSYTKESVEKIREKIALADTEEKVTSIIIGSSTLGEDVKNGAVIGKYNLDSLYYSALTEEAFSLSYYETSNAISIATALDEGYYILYRTRKSEEHFNDCYEYIASVYVENKIGEILETRASALEDSLKTTEFFNTLDHSLISMDN